MVEFSLFEHYFMWFIALITTTTLAWFLIAIIIRVITLFLVSWKKALRISAFFSIIYGLVIIYIAIGTANL